MKMRRVRAPVRRQVASALAMSIARDVETEYSMPAGTLSITRTELAEAKRKASRRMRAIGLNSRVASLALGIDQSVVRRYGGKGMADDTATSTEIIGLAKNGDLAEILNELLDEQKAARRRGEPVMSIDEIAAETMRRCREVLDKQETR